MRLSYEEWGVFDLSMHTHKQNNSIRIILSITIQEMWVGRVPFQLLGFTDWR